MTAIRARAAAGARSDAPVPPPTGTSVARPSPPGRSSRRASLNCAASRGRRPRPSGGEQHGNAPRWPPETAKDVAALSDAALFLRSVDRIGEVHYATNKDLVLLQKRLGLPGEAPSPLSRSEAVADSKPPLPIASDLKPAFRKILRYESVLISVSREFRLRR